MGDVIRECYSGKYSLEEMLSKQTGKGGLYAYFNTYSGYDVCKLRDAGDKKAQEILSAMAYQVAKSIASMYAVFGNDSVDAIIITGGMAKDEKFVKDIKERVDKIAPVSIQPGAEVLGALSYYGKMLLRNETDVLEY
jgi:butyrate kinase